MKNNNSAYMSYIYGFIMSVLLTLASYIAIVKQIFTGGVALLFILTLAFIQLIVQMVFFLHLGKETGPRWKLTVFLFTFSIVLTVVIASIWIMYHLNYNMTPQDMNSYIIKSEGINNSK